ncbi:MAG: thiamine pyrophosphate-dependent enzyme [Candidatus Thorarchaeota archaeon]|jgi:pyruvate oxidase
MARYRCTVCNWVFDETAEGMKFKTLHNSYTCPVCGAPKSAFVPESGSKDEDATKTNVAEKIVEQLVAFGVEYIYGIPGDSNLPLIEAVRRNENMRFILTRHEETGAFMAAGQAKITDKLGVCISIAGPGATNLITGLMDAATDRSPVLALVGQIPEVYLGSEGFQEIDQIELFRPFAEYAETVARSNQALKLTMMAAKYALKKPGLAVLSCPTDVLVDKLDDSIIAPDKRLFRSDTVATHESIAEAVKLIDDCTKPVVFGGWGSRHCGDLLIELAEKLKAPIATTSRAKGVILETHKYAVGVLGSIGAKHAAQSIRDSDLVIIIGSGFRQANLVPAGVKILQIDNDPTRVGKTFDVDVGLVGDAPEILRELVPKVKEKQENKEFLAKAQKMREEHMRELEEVSKDTTTPINPGYLIQTLRKNVPMDSIITVDVGDHTYWTYSSFVAEGQRFYLCANMASMGFGFPAALAAKLVYPEKQVVCITGDGGFAMLMADFTTAIRENLPVKVIVFNDGALKNIKKEQLRDGYPVYGVEFPNPNFAQFAESCGGFGIRVEKAEDLDGAIKAAFASDKPTIVDVLVDPDKMKASTKRVT